MGMPAPGRFEALSGLCSRFAAFARRNGVPPTIQTLVCTNFACIAQMVCLSENSVYFADNHTKIKIIKDQY